ncbi:MAG: FprA family A-type flavoprotein [Bacteroidales bacterium]|nr:FprA family A-type flavoprotein [Bacteroidales bacterium]MBN2634357.1 FprA family A-type flavoprotein [Bacteroidales bacterium]
MKAKDDRTIDITDGVKWIGVLDYDITTFDIVMTTEFGTTYNSYFIGSEKKAIVEVAKLRFFDTYVEKLRSLTDPSQISYIILNHTEPDHSGSLRRLLELAPDATVVGSGNAIRYLGDMLNIPFRSLTVKDGDTLDLGNRTLKFISAPNLHWPDSMYTWLEEEKILFTCDSFGAHYCDAGMKDELSEDYLKAFKYYFDVILKPFSRFMIKAIERIKPLNAEYICTGHGPILRDNRNTIVDLTEKYAREYLELTQEQARRRVLIAYVSAYGYTKMAAELIAAGIREISDFSVELADIELMEPGEMDARLTVADALLVGSPTINQNTLLPVYKLFAVINPIRDRGKLAGVFGSYGWSGEAPVIISSALKNLKLKVFDEPASFKFLPGGDKEEMLREYGRRFGKQFEEECAGK